MQAEGHRDTVRGASRHLHGGLPLGELGLIGSRSCLPLGDALLMARHYAFHLLPQRQRLLGGCFAFRLHCSHSISVL